MTTEEKIKKKESDFYYVKQLICSVGSDLRYPADFLSALFGEVAYGDGKSQYEKIIKELDADQSLELSQTFGHLIMAKLFNRQLQLSNELVELKGLRHIAEQKIATKIKHKNTQCTK